MAALKVAQEVELQIQRSLKDDNFALFLFLFPRTLVVSF